MRSSSLWRSTYVLALLNACCDGASSAALLLSPQFSNAPKDVVKLVKVCSKIVIKFSICFCWFLSICSAMPTLFVLLSALSCSCDVLLLPLMFINIFLNLKCSVRTVRKVIKNVNFYNGTLPGYLRTDSTET